MSIDLYSPLFRWANRQGENFTTDAFVFLVKTLLAREPELGRRFLGWLCFNEETAFRSKSPEIGTQLHTTEGTPDIHITAPGIFSLVEVKKGSDLHEGQLTQYHDILRQQSAQRKSLILLTAFGTTFSESEVPILWRRWSEVADWLRQCQYSDSVSNWLVQQFLTFLRRQVMTIEKVDWQYVEGTKALLNLTVMLSRALEQAQIQVWRSQASNYSGFYTKDKQFWVGIFLDRPEFLRFQFEFAKPDEQKISKEVNWEVLDGHFATWLDLSSESVHFFSLSKENQLKRVTDFVKEAHGVAMNCVASGDCTSTPPPQV